MSKLKKETSINNNTIAERHEDNMLYVKFEEKIELNDLNKKFLKPFDGAFLVYDEYFTDSRGEYIQGFSSPEKQFKNSQIKENIIRHLEPYDWAGTLYWMNDHISSLFFPFADKWFQENHRTMFDGNDDGGISNLLLFVKTETGHVFIDTQEQRYTEIENLMSEFLDIHGHEIDKSTILKVYSEDFVDCLVLGYLGKDIDKILINLYKEKLLSNSIFFHCWEEFYAFVINERKTVILTGDFGLDYEDIFFHISYIFPISESEIITKDSWVWVGENPNNDLIKKANTLNAKVSTITDLIDQYLSTIDNFPYMKVKG